jgi:ATP-dependent DNA ligase
VVSRLGQGPAPIAGVERGSLPDRVIPQRCTLSTDPPKGPGWVAEVKYDGYRLLIWKDADDVRLLTRNAQDWSPRLPALRGQVAGLDRAAALLDESWSRWMRTGFRVSPFSSVL